MTTAWRCAPCQRMRRIQITQSSGSRACNLLAKIDFRCGWLCWKQWDCIDALLGRSTADRVAATRAHASQGSIRQLSLQSKFLPSFRERYSPPNPESAWIGRNLGWRNCLVPTGNKPFLESMLTRLCHRMASLSNNEFIELWYSKILPSWMILRKRKRNKSNSCKNVITVDWKIMSLCFWVQSKTVEWIHPSSLLPWVIPFLISELLR